MSRSPISLHRRSWRSSSPSMLFLLLLLLTFSASSFVSSQRCEYDAAAMNRRFEGHNIPQTCIEVPEDGRIRCFYTYVPPCASGASPVVIDLHGLGSCPYVVALQNQWIPKADEECMILLYPQGNSEIYDPYDEPCWQIAGGLNLPPAPGSQEALRCCCAISAFPALTSETYDYQFLQQIVATAAGTVVPQLSNDAVSVDTTRIYIGGHSNGCIQALGTTILGSDWIAAVACTGGVAVTAPPDDYIPTPIMTIRGAYDNQVPYDGFWAADFGLLGLPSTESAFQYFSDLHNCTSNTTSVELVPEMDLNGTEGTMTTTTTVGCDDAKISLVYFNTAGHQTLNNAPERFPLGAANTTVDITAMMWDFLSEFRSAEAPDLGNYTVINGTTPTSSPVAAPETSVPTAASSTSAPSMPTSAALSLWGSSRVAASLLCTVFVLYAGFV